MVYNNLPGERVFVSWSGGKDSYLSLLLAREQGLDPVCLLSFIGADDRSRSHGLRTEMLKAQASALDIPIELKEVTWEGYEAGFEEAVNLLKTKQGLSGGVFGDINLQEHRQWLEKMCSRCGIGLNLPLWMMEERKVSEELIRRGAKALLVSIRSDLIDESWLGKVMDEDYIDYCLQKEISPCGEGGEAHTLIIDGPLFSEPLKYRLGAVEYEKQRAWIETRRV